jgi:hypothetical protein
MKDFATYSAEAVLRHDQLFAQLAGIPIVDVLGVVSPDGVAGSHFRGEELWTLSFTLRFWRIHGGTLQARPLTVRRKVRHEGIAEFQKLIQRYASFAFGYRVGVVSSPDSYAGVATLPVSR